MEGPKSPASRRSDSSPADVSLGEGVGQRKGPNLAFAFQTLLSAKQITVIIPFAYFAQ